LDEPSLDCERALLPKVYIVRFRPDLVRMAKEANGSDWR
jgi:hypothetical protein